MGNSLEITRTIVILDHIGKQIYCGWQFNEGDLQEDYTPFGSIEGLERFLEDAKKLLPNLEVADAHARDLGGLDWEDAVALTLIHQVGSESACYLGEEQLEKWQTCVFGDSCEEAAEAFPEELREMTWDKKYSGNYDNYEKEIKALNLHLYLSNPCEAAKRAARRLGFTLKPEDGRLSFERQEEPAAADSG